MTKLIVFGSARVDAFMDLPDDGAHKLCKIDTQKCVIELNYAEKIPMEDVQFLVGGNGANVALGANRLGVSALLSAEVGQGPLADYVKSELSKEMDVSLISQTEGVNQGFGAVIVYQGERTILSYYSPHEPPFPGNSCEAEWFYLTSVGEKFEGYFEKVYAEMEHCNPKLVFNPSGRQIAKGAEWLKKYLDKTYLLIVNREEAQKISGLEKTSDKEKDLLNALSNLGPELVVITDGSNGSYAKEGDKFYRLGVLPVDAIERTGAGDAFSTGCMSALIQGKPLTEAMVIGTLNSTSVVGYVGSVKGLLTKDQLPEWLERAKSNNLEVEEF